MREGWDSRVIGDLVEQIKRPEFVAGDRDYPLLGMRWYAGGPFHRETVTKASTKATRLFQVEVGDFIYNRLFAWKGSFGVVNRDLAGSYVSGEFPTFRTDPSRLIPEYLFLYMAQEGTWQQILLESTGSTATSRNRWKEDRFLSFPIALPPIPEQRRIVDLISSVDAAIDAANGAEADCERALAALLFKDLPRPGLEGEPVSKLLSRSIGGVWGGEPESSEVDVRVFRSTEFDRSGVLDSSGGVTRSITVSQLGSRLLRKDDLLLEKSGGGPNQPVGRVVRVPELERQAVCANFVQLLTPDPAVIEPIFAFYLLFGWHLIGLTQQFQRRTTGIRNLQTKSYLSQRVQLPTRRDQQRLGLAFEGIDGERLRQRETGATMTRLRSALLSDLLSGDHEIPDSYDRFLEDAA